jgi:hypothetical protein
LSLDVTQVKAGAVAECDRYMGSSDYNRSMINVAKRQTLHIWIAMLAILFSALAPTVSHALAAAGTAVDTAEICTMDGYKLVKLTGSDSGKAPAPAQHGMEHCPFCATHSGSHLLAATPFVVFALDAGRDAYPALFYTAPPSLHVWSAANPRAPPFLA